MHGLVGPRLGDPSFVKVQLWVHRCRRTPALSTP